MLVTATYAQQHETTLDVTISGEVIHTTDEHPFYVVERGWVEAGQLAISDAVLAAYGTLGVVEAVTVIPTPQTMYNLTIEWVATYLVGDGQWVVHNIDLCNLNTRTLLVGEGDFSFANSIVSTNQVSPRNLVATSYDAFSQLPAKAHPNLNALRNAGVRIWHGVDARLLHTRPELGEFDRIIWNFPHVGGPRDRNIRMNQDLIKAFFGSGPSRLSNEGLIAVTLKGGRPYTSWGIVQRAAEQGLRLVDTTSFDLNNFPGYRPITTIDSMPVDFSRPESVPSTFFFSR